ncbi:unnamed protein product [Toxocara canis]|uniref:Uncharacterized protein n=1 Tax=Toxocara canis TaxID=6265 RepID=A0A183UV52_TOXCA|nr:unnamed protein product [Toxocara canis]
MAATTPKWNASTQRHKLRIEAKHLRDVSNKNESAQILAPRTFMRRALSGLDVHERLNQMAYRDHETNARSPQSFVYLHLLPSQAFALEGSTLGGCAPASMLSVLKLAAEAQSHFDLILRIIVLRHVQRHRFLLFAA